ncbi:hypothetical protein Pmani_007584 [Petrolisthes manimaculis]|uniref:HMG box domain-containing protein n=1 Tax=Petrolisthes manimaculis TaxID=1843537 RepID=A0AAE1QAE7_9EUCA|nr:hypothetical protein Pmani_007584 [Petrolisthes manimaculis]
MFGGGDADSPLSRQNNVIPGITGGQDTGDKYYKKHNSILRRCSSIQKENEMLVNRVYQVKKIVRRLRKERKFLMEELDKRGDNYRSLPLTIAIEEEEKAFPLPQASQSSSLPALGRPRSSGVTSGGKKQSHGKREKTERDPAAPKRASNAFVHFCQEQRDVIAAAPLPPSSPSSSTTTTTTTAGRPLDKKQLTRLLATRWNALAEDDKKVYIEKYERDKERLSEERKHYQGKKAE